MSRKLIPILFSTPMVQTILAGRKTQTRRVLKPKRPLYFFVEDGIPYETTAAGTAEMKCPYGQPGDILWVRETWRNMKKGFDYKADFPDRLNFTWKPSIHMPREACRLFLRIKSVRVERLQDITERDAKAEGVELLQPRHLYRNYKPNTWPQDGFSNPVSSFESLWRKINGGESWEVNPWVWVIEFERITKEEALS